MEHIFQVIKCRKCLFPLLMTNTPNNSVRNALRNCSITVLTRIKRKTQSEQLVENEAENFTKRNVTNCTAGLLKWYRLERKYLQGRHRTI